MKELNLDELHAISGGKLPPMDVLDFALTGTLMITGINVALATVPRFASTLMLMSGTITGSLVGAAAGYGLSLGTKYLLGDYI